MSPSVTANKGRHGTENTSDRIPPRGDEELDVQVVREQQAFRADAEGRHQDPRVPEEEARARVGGQDHDRAPGEERPHHDLQRASRGGHRQEGRGHRDAALRSAQDDGRRRRPQHRGDQEARDRCAADFGLHLAAAREAHHVPPRDEARDAERDAPGRPGHQDHVRGASQRNRDRADASGIAKGACRFTRCAPTSTTASRKPRRRTASSASRSGYSRAKCSRTTPSRRRRRPRRPRRRSARGGRRHQE